MNSYNYSKVESSFIDLLNRLMNEVININSNFKLYKHLIDRLKDRRDAMEYAPSFFNTVLEALFADVVMSLAKLFETERRGSYGNLHTYLKFVTDNKEIFSLDERFRRDPNIGALEDYIKEGFKIEIEDLLKEHENLIKEQGVRIDILLHWRDKYYAHNDKRYFINPSLIAEEMPLLYDDIDKLIDTTTKILNAYSVRFDGKFKLNYFSNYDDIDKILDIVHEYHLKMLNED